MSRDRGFSLVEVMVSLAVIGVAAGLIFGVQTRMTGALRDQQNVSEVQQTLRSAATVITKDIRQAGYMAYPVYWKGDQTVVVAPIQVTNGNPDTIEIVSARDDCGTHVARVCNSGTGGLMNCAQPGHGFDNNVDAIEVDDNTCFHNGDLIVAQRTISIEGTTPVAAGTGCVLQVTHDPVAPTAGNNALIAVSETPATTWNPAGNDQCQFALSGALNTIWNDGYTMVRHFRARSYRIKPDDIRGVLQLCDRSAIVNSCSPTSTDWQDVALGIVDLQIALRVAHDPSNTIEWISGDNLAPNTIDALGNPQILKVAVTLVAKTTKGVNGPSLTEVPSLMDSSVVDPLHNPLSDRAAIPLPVSSSATWPLTMYTNDVVYRIYTMSVDLRNVGVGVTEAAPP